MNNLGNLKIYKYNVIICLFLIKMYNKKCGGKEVHQTRLKCQE